MVFHERKLRSDVTDNKIENIVKMKEESQNVPIPQNINVKES